MQIVEVGQIHNDGYWCGNAYGYNVYYSVSRNVRVTFRLYRLSEGGNFGVDEASQFYIKLRYKFVSKARAVIDEVGCDQLGLNRPDPVGQPVHHFPVIGDAPQQRHCRMRVAVDETGHDDTAFARENVQTRMGSEHIGRRANHRDCTVNDGDGAVLEDSAGLIHRHDVVATHDEVTLESGGTAALRRRGRRAGGERKHQKRK